MITAGKVSRIFPIMGRAHGSLRYRLTDRQRGFCIAANMKRRQIRHRMIIFYIGYNFHSGLSHLALPKLPQNKKWYLLMTTAAENSFLPEKEILEDQHLLAIEGQSTIL